MAVKSGSSVKFNTKSRGGPIEKDRTNKHVRTVIDADGRLRMVFDLVTITITYGDSLADADNSRRITVAITYSSRRIAVAIAYIGAGVSFPQLASKRDSRRGSLDDARAESRPDAACGDRRH
jgi:hypothetical protein